MSYSLPKYYFQDIHPDVMEEIMRGMEAALPEPIAAGEFAPSLTAPALDITSA